MSENLINLAAQLSDLSDEQLVAVFQAVFSTRPRTTPEPWIRSSHYFVGIAYQLDESDDGNPPQWSSWKISAIAKPDVKEYGHRTSELFVGADWGFCQEGMLVRLRCLLEHEMGHLPDMRQQRWNELTSTPIHATCENALA